jgi:hypothetical protein
MRHWTPEERAEQARKISAWQPWGRSTGPRTDTGRARSAQNRAISLDAARAKIDALVIEHQKSLKELERLTGKKKSIPLFGTVEFHLKQIQKMLGQVRRFST